jgi:alpha-galactosidase
MKPIGLLLSLSLAGSLQAQIVSPNTNLNAREEAIIAAAKPGAAPRFNGPRLLGIRPRTPFLHSLAVSGAGPMMWKVEDLPAGLKFDPKSGIISGTLTSPGEFIFRATAANSRGNATAEFKIVCGDTLALLPPMGWNSYDAFGDSVRESEVLANAAWLKEYLQPLGWDTVVVDFRWYDSKADGIRVQNPEGVTIDEFGRCIPPTNRFPSAANGAGFKPLADKIHALGLKFGIHIMRGIPRKAVDANTKIAGSNFTAAQAPRPEWDTNRTCRWNRDMFGVDASTDAGKAWYASIGRQYAEWGVDYIKCDDIAQLERGTNRYPRLEVEALANGLRAGGRSIVLSLSPGPALVQESEHLGRFANLWRISGDFWDNWRSLNRNFDLFAAWQSRGSPGHWPDGDMIPFAHICQRNCDVRPDRWTRFTRDEQLTLMSLWALAPSPLMLGMNLPDNDAWTTAILSHPEVLAVNQDWPGRAAEKTSPRMAVPAPDGPSDAVLPEIWVKKLSDDSSAIGFFNRSGQPLKFQLPWSSLGFKAPPEVRDVWLRKDLGKQETFTAELPPHGCVLLKVQ